MSFEKFSLTKQIALAVLHGILEVIFSGKAVPIAHEIDWGKPLVDGDLTTRTVIVKFFDFEIKITMKEYMHHQGEWLGTAEVNAENSLLSLDLKHSQFGWSVITDGNVLMDVTVEPK